MIQNVVLILGGIVLAALFYGKMRWRRRRRDRLGRLEASRLPRPITRFDPQELATLPPPVQRYLRAALTPGQAMVAAVDIEQAGTINLSETAASWKPFTAAQRVITRRPGFDWDARIALLPGLGIFVHDSYLAGEGYLQATVLGLLTKANLRDRGEMARGELMRFLAEAACYPTALLASQGVVWSPSDDHAAQATLTDGAVTVTLLFRFDAGDLIDTVRAEARGRTINGKMGLMAWEGRFWNYTWQDGMRIPHEGEVAWMSPIGAMPYWRGKSTRLTYEFSA